MFKTNRSKEAVKDFEGGNNDYLTKSGIYENVTIHRAIYDESENGGAVINFFVSHNGVKQTLYGNLRVANKGGKPNQIGLDRFNELLVILGLDGLGEPIEEDLPIGKKGAMKTVAVFEEIEDVEVDIKITNRYSVWNNNIKEESNIVKFYRAGDHATAAEILLHEENPDEVELGSKYKKDLEFADNVKYEDGLTEADVKEWIRAKRPKGTGGSVGGASASKPSFRKPVKKFGK
jgi:hypothetical protein